MGNLDKGVGVTRGATGSFKSGNAGTHMHLRKHSRGNVKIQRQWRSFLYPRWENESNESVDSPNTSMEDGEEDGVYSSSF